MRFDALEIEHDERVLTPRGWTACQSRWAAELLVPRSGDLLELFTGAGQIGLLALHLARARTDVPTRRAVLVDADEHACAVARANATRNELGDLVEVRHAPVQGALGTAERFAVVLLDPPYVPTARVAAFPEDPVTAIDGGEDGLALARVALSVAAGAVQPSGAVLLQLADDHQADQISAWLDQDRTPPLRPTDRRRHPRGVVVRLDP